MRVTRYALTLLALGLALPSLAQPTIWDHHVDIGINYTALGGWDLHIHDETDLTEYAPDEAFLGVGWQAQQARPAGVQFDFIGVGAGDPVWILPQVQDPSLLFLGLGAEELDPDNLFEDWDPDGAGGLVDKMVKFPIWFDPRAYGGTPMKEAFQKAQLILKSWLEQHPNCFPPVVIHITDGMSTDGDPSPEMNSIGRFSAATPG